MREFTDEIQKDVIENIVNIANIIFPEVQTQSQFDVKLLLFSHKKPSNTDIF